MTKLTTYKIIDNDLTHVAGPNGPREVPPGIDFHHLDGYHMVFDQAGTMVAIAADPTPYLPPPKPKLGRFYRRRDGQYVIVTHINHHDEALVSLFGVTNNVYWVDTEGFINAQENLNDEDLVVEVTYEEVLTKIGGA